MSRSLYKSKGRADGQPVAVIPKSLLESDEYAGLTAFEAKLLLDMAAQFNGHSNNGDLQCTWSEMRKRGWRSQDTLWRAMTGLLDKGFLVRTRQGGKHKCNLFAVTWREIHECKGKLDMRPTRSQIGLWRKKSVLRKPEYIATPAVAKLAVR